MKTVLLLITIISFISPLASGCATVQQDAILKQLDAISGATKHK